jgi:predicted  nucleic acid-binding Zn-ribbon protein
VAELQSSLSSLTKERDALHLQSASRDRELAELRREVGNVIEKKRRLEAELERLRAHLLAVEETYTGDALAAEDRERELRKKLQVFRLFRTQPFTVFSLVAFRDALINWYFKIAN